MMWTRRSARPASRWLGLTGAALAVAPSLACSQPQDLFFERTAMSAVGERCRLFTPQTAAALAAAAQQARGSALRAGVGARELAAMERDVRARARGVDCKAPSTLAAAARVRDAFSGYAKVTRMTYPGQMADWRADRSVTRAARWRLSQQVHTSAGRVTFGLAGQEGPEGLLAVGEFAAAPYSARLVVRDAGRTLGPYLVSNNAALSTRLPPRSATRAYLAEARAAAEAELLPRDARSGWAFRFPAAAQAALAGLDPREAVAVEFLFPGERVVTAYVEVGDFAAGRAFVQLAAR